jgi:hypothetical protein
VGVDATKPSVLDATGAASRRGRAPARRELSQGALGWLFVAPIVVVIVVLVGYPLLLSLQMSVQDVADYPGEQTHWVGLGNYLSLERTDPQRGHPHAPYHHRGQRRFGLAWRLRSRCGTHSAGHVRSARPAVARRPSCRPSVDASRLDQRLAQRAAHQLGLINHYQICSATPGTSARRAGPRLGAHPAHHPILLGGLGILRFYEAAHIDGAPSAKAPLHHRTAVRDRCAALAIGTVVAFGISTSSCRDGSRREVRDDVIYLTTFGNPTSATAWRWP